MLGFHFKRCPFVFSVMRNPWHLTSVRSWRKSYKKKARWPKNKPLPIWRKWKRRNVYQPTCGVNNIPRTSQLYYENNNKHYFFIVKLRKKFRVLIRWTKRDSLFLRWCYLFFIKKKKKIKNMLEAIIIRDAIRFCINKINIYRF